MGVEPGNIFLREIELSLGYNLSLWLQSLPLSMINVIIINNIFEFTLILIFFELKNKVHNTIFLHNNIVAAM